jgi:hypothetical protein
LLYTADLLVLIETLGRQSHLFAEGSQAYELSSRHHLANCSLYCTVELLGLSLVEHAFMSSAAACVKNQDVPKYAVSGLGVMYNPWILSACIRWHRFPCRHDPGIDIDCDVSMRTRVNGVTSGCFAVVHQLQSLRRPLAADAFKLLVADHVLIRLDYDKGVLTGIH